MRMALQRAAGAGADLAPQERRHARRGGAADRGLHAVAGVGRRSGAVRRRRMCASCAASKRWSSTWRSRRNWGAPAARAGCASRACAWMAATKRRPIGWTDVYIDPAYADIADMVRESPETLISSLIETRYGRRIARIRQDIRAISGAAALAERAEGRSRLTGAADRSPLSRRGRRGVRDLGHVHPADRFTFSMQLNRSREQ